MGTVYCLSARDPQQIHVSGAARTDDGIEVDIGANGPEAILYGPYYPLKKGDYEGSIRFDPTVPVTASGHFDVVCDQASLTLVERAFSAREIIDNGFQIKLAFSVPHDVFDFELRLYLGPNSRCRITEVEIYEKAAAREVEPSRIRHNDHRFRAPIDLRRTETEVERILVVGSCMAGTLIVSAPSAFAASTKVDHILVNFAGDLPEKLPQPIDKYAFQLIVLPLRTVLPETATSQLDYGDLSVWNAVLDESRQRLLQLLESALAYHTRHGLTAFVSTFLVPQQNSMGRLLAQNDARNPVWFVRQLNELIVDFVTHDENMYVLDADEIASSIGKKRIQDDVITFNSHGTPNPGWGYELDLKRLHPPQPMSEAYELRHGEFFKAVWNEVAAMYRTIRQQDSVKIVICDLDDTLWRGVLAEEDMSDEARLGGWPLGLIEALTILKQRGILLAICSKNDESTIRARWSEVIGDRLPIDSFAIVKINWEPKADNIAAILGEASLLPRSALFIDDNPVERAAVEAAYPDIRTLGADLYYIRRILMWAPEMQTVDISRESARRTEMIKAQVDRESARKVMPREEFLASLHIEIRWTTISDTSVPELKRAFELINKSNQFNTTGRRWKPEEMQQFLAEGGRLETFRVKDRFTDYGLVCVAIVRGDCIEQYVMSCRVLGLDVEKAAVGTIARAIAGPHGKVRGVVTETDANLICRDVFAKSGFNLEDDGWTAVGGSLPPLPPHVKVVSDEMAVT